MRFMFMASLIFNKDINYINAEYRSVGTESR